MALFMGILAGLLITAGHPALAQDGAANPTPPEAESAAADTAVDQVAEVASRSAALELAGAFANDGYKVRDSFLTQQIDVASPAIIEVNLFAGNEYWFSAAVPPQESQKIAVTVFDQHGHIVDQQHFDEGFRYAAGFEPAASGSFYVRIRLVEGEATPVTFVYSYK